MVTEQQSRDIPDLELRASNHVVTESSQQPFNSLSGAEWTIAQEWVY